LCLADFHCHGNTVSNAWKVLNAAKNKWFVLYADTKEEKEAWLNEFILERERKRSKSIILLQNIYNNLTKLPNLCKAFCISLQQGCTRKQTIVDKNILTGGGGAKYTVYNKINNILENFRGQDCC